MNAIVIRLTQKDRTLANAISLKTIQETLNAKLITEKSSKDVKIKVVCASDLMSDVLAYSSPGSMLLTSLVSPQSIRTADIADMLAICFVFGKEPSQEMTSLAESSGIPLLVSEYSLFCASGKLYEIGLSGCLPRDD
jgi:predicted transcriptional regulator